MEKHKTNIEAIHTKVDKTIGEIIQALKARQQEIHSEVNTEAKKEEDALSADVRDAELILTRLDSGINFTDRLLQTAGDSELVSMARQTLEQCKKLEGIKIENRMTHVLEWDFDKAGRHSDKVEELKVKVKLPMNYHADHEER